MCLGWLIFCPDRVQILELWGNSDFISPFLYLDISLQKTKKALKNQGFLWRYLFYRPLMVAEAGFEPYDLRRDDFVQSFPSRSKCAIISREIKMDISFEMSSLVAEAGFEPYDLRVMSPTSYQAAPLRDI